MPYSYIFSYKISQNRFYTGIIELLNPLSQKKEIRVDFKKSIPLIFCQDDFDWMFQLLVTMMIMCFFHLELSMEKISLWRILKDSLFQYYKYENWGREKCNFLKFTQKLRSEARSGTQLMWKRSNATCNVKLAKVIKVSSIIT